jgi:nicotinamidase-related amidase
MLQPTGRSQGRFAVSGSAVVVIDMQNDFCHPEGALAQAGHDVRAPVSMAPRLRDFITGVRTAGVPVWFFRTTHDDDTDTAVWVGRRQRDGLPPDDRILACRTGTWGCEPYVVAEQPGDRLGIKHRYSIFTLGSLDEELRRSGVTSLFFTGVLTDACVETSLRDALCREYHVTLVEDCCAAYEGAAHEATVRSVNRHFGVVLTADEVLTALGDPGAG